MLARDLTAIFLALITAAVIADLITHGSTTAALARTIADFGNSGLAIAAGQGARTIR